MKNDGTFGTIDNLTISYDGNRLLKVTDNAEAVNYNGSLDFHDGADTECEYEYDSNGALKKDSNRGIKSITYDYGHHPYFINMNQVKKSNNITNDYTPDGRKLSSSHKITIANANGYTRKTTTDLYIDGLIVRDGTPLLWQFDGGYVDLDANGAPTSWNYYVTDHLGSTRMVVDSKNNIKETINYYPFGSEMRMEAPAQIQQTDNGLHPFRFTGKELDKQNGLNMYDFGARLFDVAGVPMWTSVDPLTEDNLNVTPYMYCAGDPVNKFDPDGRDWICATYDDEQFVYFDERIHNQEDIEKYYSNSKTIFYLGATGTIYQGTEDGNKLCYSLKSDGRYTDAEGNILQDEISVSNKLHVGSSVVQKNVQPEINMYGIYLGPNNPQTEKRDIYAIPPVDMLDYAAFRHDKGYDNKNTAGISGVFLNSSNYGDDWNLSIRSLNEVLTSDVTSSRWRWALATSSLFGPLAIIKKLVRIIK